jgi:hypothetical protein
LIDFCWLVLEKSFEIFQCIFTLLLLSLLGEGLSPSFEQTCIPSIKGWFVSSLVKIGPMVLEKIFKLPNPIFTFFFIISSLKRTWPFIWTNLISPHPKIICLIEFGQLVLEKKIFKNFQCIFTRLLLSPLGEGLFPSFEQTWVPSTQGWFVPSLIKISQVVLEKKQNM